MSLIRPTGGLFGWASGSSGAGNITQPTQNHRNLGWQPNTSLDAQHLNAAFGSNHQWHAWHEYNATLTHRNLVGGDYQIRSIMLGPTGVTTWGGTGWGATGASALQAGTIGGVGGRVMWTQPPAGTIGLGNTIRAWAFVRASMGASGGLFGSFGIAGASNSSQGVYTVTLATGAQLQVLANSHCAVVANCVNGGTASGFCIAVPDTQLSVSSQLVVVRTYRLDGSLANRDFVVTVMGE